MSPICFARPFKAHEVCSQAATRSTNNLMGRAVHCYGLHFRGYVYSVNVDGTAHGTQCSVLSEDKHGLLYQWATGQESSTLCEFDTVVRPLANA